METSREMVNAGDSVFYIEEVQEENQIVSWTHDKVSSIDIHDITYLNVQLLY